MINRLKPHPSPGSASLCRTKAFMKETFVMNVVELQGFSSLTLLCQTAE